MHERWFRWSVLYGIKPIHRNGWVLLGSYFFLAVPSGLLALGLADYPHITRPIGVVMFITVSILFFWKVFDRM